MFIKQTAVERKGDILKRFYNFCAKVRARTWSRLSYMSYMCRVCLTTALRFALVGSHGRRKGALSPFSTLTPAAYNHPKKVW